MKVKKIVLTGGPCAGKTTVLDVLRQRFAGQVLVVPEVASILLSGGFPVPGKDVNWSPEWQKAFQSAILSVQIQVENVYELKGIQEKINLLICDRGILDGAAYTPGGLDAFCKFYRIPLKEALGRYSAVIHLESLAVGNPELYGKTNNSNRFEALTEAQKLEYSARQVWKSHPRFCFVNCKRGIEGKISKAIEIVKNFLE